jgi:hypothetical protein
MRRSTRFAAKWWQAGVAITAFVIAIGALAIAYPTLLQTQRAAKAGKAARIQQCSFYPTALKEQRFFYQHRVIASAELAKYTRFGPYCAAISRAAAKP